MRSLLFGVHAWDFSTLAGVAAVLEFCSVAGQLDPGATGFVGQSGGSAEC